MLESLSGNRNDETACKPYETMGDGSMQTSQPAVGI